MPDELPELHRRAAAGEPDLVRRIGYRIRAGDWTEAEVELAEAGGRIITTVGAAPVLRLLDQFPAAAACALRPTRAHPLPLRLGPLGLAEHARGGASGRAAPTRAPATRLGAWRAGLYEAISYGSFGFTDEARRRVDEPPPEPLGVDDRAFLAMTRTYQTFDEGRLDVLGQRYREVIDALESSTNIPLWYHCVPRSMQCGMPGMDGPLARFAAGALRGAARHADAAAGARPGAARLGGALGGQGRGRRGVGGARRLRRPLARSAAERPRLRLRPAADPARALRPARPKRAARSTS